MARTQTAFLPRKNVPERPPLQAALDSLRFKLTLDDSYAPFETSGYLPCTLDGEDAGFDIRFQNVPADLSPVLKAAVADSDTAIGFRWSGDPREQFAAFAVCAALAVKFGAVVHEPDADALLSFEQLMAKIRQTEASF